MAAAACRRPHSIVFRDDRTRAWRRRRPFDAQDHREAGRRSLRDQRNEMVHHRRDRRGVHDRDGEDGRRLGEHVSRRYGSARHPRRAADGRDGCLLRGRPRRCRIQESARSRRRRARRNRPGLSLRAGAPRTRTAHALHALARTGAPRARCRDRLRAPPRGVRQDARRARRRGLHARRQRDGPADGAAAHLAHRLAARSGRAVQLRVEPRQGGLLGGRVARRRSLRADPRRPRRDGRSGGVDEQQQAHWWKATPVGNNLTS